jgi:hypothetical protein
MAGEGLGMRSARGIMWRVIGSKRARGFVVFSFACAVACGNTGNNGNGRPTQGASGDAGSAGSGASAGTTDTAGSAGNDDAGSDAGGSANGGTSTAGNAGESGAPSQDPPHQVELVRDKVPNKLDLLLMIDNSISMDDKQQLLADAMQHLVERLLHPRCLDDLGELTGQQSTTAGVCPVGSHPEYLPFNDIHAAVITSSLGSHGAVGARDVCLSVEDDDHARLLGSIRPGLPSWNQSGFLAWDPQQQLSPVGIGDSTEFAAALAETVEAAGDKGCGYEAQLEAWYRFLIDPEPPAAVVVANGSTAEVQGVNAEVLAERAAFLRSDSVLGIVMLSDENDCSIQDGGYGWLIARSAPMYRSTSICHANPNDECCQSCAEQSARAGCPPLAGDVECAKGSTLAAGEDDLNLRCFEQKRRFGFDLLYPVQRYIDGLTSPLVTQRSTGDQVPNPIYVSRNGAPPRSPEQVLLLGIVGVPWQDVSDAASLTGQGLKFLGEDGPLSAERWDVILGNPAASPPEAPLDPFMIETPEDRTTLPGVPAANPIVPAELLVASGSTDPRANRINGHETVNIGSRDLQFACTFPLQAPILCDQARNDADGACDCFAEDAPYNRSVCQPPGGGPTSITQYWGTAYPGLRELAVLKGVGGHGIVASACPKSSELTAEAYGYRPAMDALAGRVAKQVGRSCLTRDANAMADGSTPCKIVTAAPAGVCSCDAAQGLSAPPDEIRPALLEELESVGYCGGGVSCNSLCLCELGQLKGTDLVACQTAADPPNVPGFCYLNAVPGEAHAGDPVLASDCVGAAPRRIRFTGGAPATSIALLYCAE